MIDGHNNPFQTTEIKVRKSLHETVKQYCRPNEDFDQRPFPRMIDLWFLSICVAIRLELEPLSLATQNTVKFADGTIFSNDAWRINILRLVAIERSGDVNIVLEPKKMIVLANNLANAGLPKVVEMLKNGGDKPIWNLSESLSELLDKGESSEITDN